MIKNSRGTNLPCQENQRILQLNKSLKPMGFSQAYMASVSGGQLQTRHPDSPCVRNKNEINNEDNRWSCGRRTKMGFKWKSLLTVAGGQTQPPAVWTRRSERPTGPWRHQPADAKADLGVVWGGQVNYLRVVKRYCSAEYYYFNLEKKAHESVSGGSLGRIILRTRVLVHHSECRLCIWVSTKNLLFKHKSRGEVGVN